MWRQILMCGLALALVGCSGDGAKIGSTVKGKRIAVLEQNKAIKADSDLKDHTPHLPNIVDNANWAQAGFDSAHMMPNAEIAVHPQKIWSSDIGNGSDSDFKLLARPVINNGLIFTMDARGLISAFDVKDGDRKWTFDTTPEDADECAISGGLAADGTTLYATSGFGEVFAFNAADGKLLWRNSVQNPVHASPTYANGRLYVVSITNRLTALDAKTGDEQWHHDGITESATLMGASNPAVEGDSVVVAYSSGEIYDLRAESGHVSWSYGLTTAAQTGVGALPAIADIRGLPVIGQGRVFAVSHSDRTAAIDHRTGDRDWEVDIGSINTPVIAGDAMFILSNEGQLIALTHDEGRVMWVQDLQHLTDPTDHDSDPVYWSGPALASDRLWLVNSMGQLASFAVSDGKPGDVIDLGAPAYITPVTAGGTMYVVTDDGTLVALH